MLGTVKFESGVSLMYGLTPDLKKGGYYIIHVRIYICKHGVRLKETEISTSIRCQANQWNGERIRGRDETAMIKNDKLENVKAILKDTLHDLKKSKINSPETLYKEIKLGLAPKISNRTSSIKKIEYLSKLQQHKVDALAENYLSVKQCSASYKRWFDNTCKLLTKFYGHTPTVCEISTQDLQKFKIWLTVTEKYKHNAMVTTLCRLRTILLHAVDKELIIKSPMPRGFVPGYVRGNREILSVGEVEKIANLKDSDLTPSLKRTKYIFLLMLSTSMGYGELKDLRKEYIKTVKNNLFLKKHRKKTGEQFEVTFSPLAKQVFERISEMNVQFEQLPSIDFMNRSIKALMEMAGVNKKVTTYVCRHSFASHWLAEGKSINALKIIMGHSDIKTTQVYEGVIPDKLIAEQNVAYSKMALHNISLN